MAIPIGHQQQPTALRKKLEAFLDGERLAKRERALGRDPDNYFLDTRNIEKIQENDIAWFFRTIELEVLIELPNGNFRTSKPGASESLFWHGSSRRTPSPVGVAIESVISLGAIGRLIDEYGWPAHCIGAQNGAWGFDLTGYSHESDQIILQCEVKTTSHEVDRMCTYIKTVLDGLHADDLATLSQRKNWDKKIKELLSAPPEVLWALGPNGYQRIFRVIRSQVHNDLRIVAGQQDDLKYRR